MASLVLFIFLVTLVLPLVVPPRSTAFFSVPSLYNGGGGVQFQERSLFEEMGLQLLSLRPAPSLVKGCQVKAGPKGEQWETADKGHSSSQSTAWTLKSNFHPQSPS